MFASGSKFGEAWKIGIRHPRSEGVIATLRLKDEAISTSGNYERFFIKEGVRYHHILDPKTGRPAQDLASVSVVARSTIISDGFSTGLFVLGVNRGMEVAKREGLEVLFIDEQLVTTPTPSLASRLVWEPK